MWKHQDGSYEYVSQSAYFSVHGYLYFVDIICEYLRMLLWYYYLLIDKKYTK